MLGDPVLAHVAPGSAIDVVIEAGVENSAIALWHRDYVRLQGLELSPGDVWTLYGAVFQGFDCGAYLLEVTDETRAFKRPPLDPQSFLRMKELCAGIGGISQGLEAAGGTTSVFVDRAAVACATIRLNGGLAILGDLAEREVRIQLHAVSCDLRHILSAGIPCQGYSRQGLGLGFKDPRSLTVLHVLQATWHSQASGLVLECVAEIQSHPEAMQCLSSFAQKAGFALHQVVLELSDQWASKRLRWWAVMVPACLPPFVLDPWPSNGPSPVVQDVIPEWPLWTSEEEAALTWDTVEQEAYANPLFGTEPRLLDGAAKCPTALHSWGAALRGCPCGCRASGFSAIRLRQQGLRGIGVPSQETGLSRFLHPQEVGLLNAVSPAFVHHSEPRTGLCLAGQLASPLQSLWIFAQLRVWTSKTSLLAAPEPLHLLEAYKRELLQQRHDKWRLPSMCGAGEIQLHDLYGHRGVSCHGPVRVGQLLAAEGQFVEPGLKLQLWRADRQLSDDDFLHIRPGQNAYQLRLLRKKASLTVSLPAQVAAPDGSALCSDVALAAGLRILCSGFPQASALAFPPLPFADLVALLSKPPQWDPDSLPLLEHRTALLPFLHEDHWTLLVVRPDLAGNVDVALWDGIPGRAQIQGRRLADCVGHLYPASSVHFQERSLWLQDGDSNCGAIVLAHASALLSGDPSPAQLCKAQAFVSAFPLLRFGLLGQGGLSEAHQAKLTSILVEHGVPEAAVEDRIRAAVQKLGPGPLAQALGGHNVWQLLKSAAGKPGSGFRWILPEELQAHIAARAQSKFGLSVPKARQKKMKAAKTPLDSSRIDPALLQLASGSFVTASGQPLGQLAYAEVRTQATGVCFCSPQQAAPFIADSCNLSVDALALLITSPLTVEEWGKARVHNFRFPCVYAPTGEAVLIAGALLQLGDEEVQAAPSSVSELECVDTVVCRLSVFRDECKMSWTSIAEAPIRALLQGAPELQVCKSATCDGTCSLYHPAVDESVEQLFVDVWARRYSRFAGGRAQPADSELFQALVRIPTSALQHLFRAAIPGFYVEPRAPDGSSHAAWSVVWLPGSSAEQARHFLKTQPKAVALVRLGTKYGLRVREAEEEQLWQILRPGQGFVKLRVAAHFKIHPLPHGFQRQGVAQLLRQWNWKGRPLQPERGDAAGSAWLVGAEEDPPSQALPLGEDFVLITKVKDLGMRRQQPSKVLATRRTARHILLDADPDASKDAPMPDPWLEGKDPWSQARSSTDTQHSRLPLPTTSPAVTKLAQIQEDLKHDLQDIVRQQVHAQASVALPGLTEQDRRLAALEVGMTEMRQQSSKFEAWFQSFGTRVSDQATAIAGLQSTVQEQQRELASYKSEFQATVNSAVTGLQQDLAQQFSSQLQGQFEQIQSLFSEKKARSH